MPRSVLVLPPARRSLAGFFRHNATSTTYYITMRLLSLIFHWLAVAANLGINLICWKDLLIHNIYDPQTLVLLLISHFNTGWFFIRYLQEYDGGPLNITHCWRGALAGPLTFFMQKRICK